jgi:hypothetical protein
MQSPFPSNATLTLALALGQMVTDGLGNRRPALITLQTQAFLDRDRDVRTGKTLPGADEVEEMLSGNLTELARVPDNWGNNPRAWLELDGRSGYFTFTRQTADPWGVSEILGAEIAGTFKPIVMPNPNQPTQTTQTTIRQYPAATALSALRLVAVAGGQLVYADGRVAAHGAATIGVTLQSVGVGEVPLVAIGQLLEDISWNWQPGQPLFVGLDGQLTQDADAVMATAGAAFLKQIGWAPKANQIYLEIEEAIYLG